MSQVTKSSRYSFWLVQLVYTSQVWHQADISWSWLSESQAATTLGQDKIVLVHIHIHWNFSLIMTKKKIYKLWYIHVLVYYDVTTLNAGHIMQRHWVHRHCVESANSWHAYMRWFKCGMHVVGMQREMGGCVDMHACIANQHRSA